MYGKTIPCSGDHREILQEGWPLYQVLETELMGLPRDWLSRATCADFTAAHHSTCGVHTHTHAYNVWYGATATCSGGRREIFWEMCYLLQGLESEGMGLPRDVSSRCNMCRLHCSPPLHTAHSHHTAPYANHAPRCESGRSQQMMGSLAGFHQLGECSSISITLLLVSQEILGRVHGSLHTPTIHCMVKPSKVWCNGVTDRVYPWCTGGFPGL